MIFFHHGKRKAKNLLAQTNIYSWQTYSTGAKAYT
jgi:hypothetical protein